MVNTPVGQLVVSAAVIDDMIALVILSQLEALASELTVLSILIPVISAFSFLILGGFVAIFLLPPFINKYLLPLVSPSHQPKLELALMFSLLLGLMPATHYAKASFLMGAFLAGLTFCRSNPLHRLFGDQFKRVLQWLMRIFFAASIGFQVPIKDFGSGIVIWQGLVFTVALVGKVATGLLVPNFSSGKRFEGVHLRDCLITGFSMAAEGEFAFVIAVFNVDSGLISQDLYASIVLAVLISTIVPPFLLRYTISRWNKRQEIKVSEAASLDNPNKSHTVKMSHISSATTFFVIQTRSETRWGLLHSTMEAMQRLNLEVIDHRSWHPRGVDGILVMECYVQNMGTGLCGEEAIEQRREEIENAIAVAIRQPADKAQVRVQRWRPGAVAEAAEDVTTLDVTDTDTDDKPVQERIHSQVLEEATKSLEKHRSLQEGATRGKSVAEITGVGDIEAPTSRPSTLQPPHPSTQRQKMLSTPVGGSSVLFALPPRPPPVEEKPVKRPPSPSQRATRLRQRMMSTPENSVINGDSTFFNGDGGMLTGVGVNGGDLLPGASSGRSDETQTGGNEPRRATRKRTMSTPVGTSVFGGKTQASRGELLLGLAPDRPANITVDGETYSVNVSQSTVNLIRGGYRGTMPRHSISVIEEDIPVEHRLSGIVRRRGVRGTGTDR